MTLDRLLAFAVLLCSASLSAQQAAPPSAVIPATAPPATVPPAASPAQQPTPAPAAQQPEADVTPGALHTAPRNEPPVEAFLRRDADTVTLALGKDALGKDHTLTLHDFDFNGDPVDTAKLHLRQLAPGVYELSSLAWTVGYWHFALKDQASYFGTGERFDTLDHAGTIVKNLSIDQAGIKGSSAYKPIPFFLSTTGYGLWLDTTGDATFDFNASDRETVSIDAPTDRLRIVLFTGQPDNPGRFPDLLGAFAHLAGRVTLPPYWAFAPWQARDFHQNQQQVMEDIDKTRALGLPASVLLIDSPWATAYNSYQPNPKQFDDFAALSKHLHEQGYKLVLWHTPWINSKSDPPGEPGFGGAPGETSKLDETSPNYAYAAENGFFVKDQNNHPYVGRWWKGQGSLIDFTNPRARDWWQDQLRQALVAGADGFKDDDGEGTFLGGDVHFADGTDPRLMRNRYGTLYNSTVEDLLQKDLKGNGVLFCRSVTTGANGFGFLWAGDNDASFSPANGLPTVVTAGLSAGLSAMPLWGADLGGYRKQPDTPNPTLLARWTEFAAYSPVMEVMSQANLTPWTFDADPSKGTPALDIYRRYAILHTSLMPYLYAAAQQAALTGQPILRALVLNYQDDPTARSLKDEYLLGPDLLVAPILDENTSRVVYLPEGDWIDLSGGKNGGQLLTGPRTLLVHAALDTIPVFARRGTVLSRIPEDVMTLVPAAQSGNKDLHTLDNRRVFEILGPAADHDTSFTDFEDRNITRSGTTLTIVSPANPPIPAGVDFANAPKEDKPHLILRWRFLTPHNVTVNGSPATVKNDASGIPTVEFDHAGTSTIVWQ